MRIRGFVHANGFFGYFKNANTFHTAWRTGEILFHCLGIDTDRFEKLRAAIRHIGRHAHLGHDL